MASKATKLKKRIRRLNATIDSNLRTLNRGNASFIDAMHDPMFPNITAKGLVRQHEANAGRREIVRHMCIQLECLQRQLVALEKKQANRYLARAEKRWNETAPRACGSLALTSDL